MKITREKFKTYKAVFDQHAEQILFKLSSQGHFLHLESPISIGKEANLFTAKRSDGTYCIAKIYRVENCDFKKMYNYLKLDPRYPHLKKNRRQVIFLWTKREYQNLLKAREAGVRVPTPYVCRDNIIIMELIGNQQTGETAPKLKDAQPKQPDLFFQQLQQQIQKLYQAGIVHGDLSKFNILNKDESPVIIDMSQTTTLGSTHARELLYRDLKNVADYFKKIGVAITEETIKKSIERQKEREKNRS